MTEINRWNNFAVTNKILIRCNKYAVNHANRRVNRADPVERRILPGTDSLGGLTTHVRGKRESGWNKDRGPTDPDIIGWSRLAVLRRRDGWKVFQLCGFRCAGWWMNRSTRRRSNFSFGAASKESGVDRETTTAVISREWRATGPPPRVLRSSVQDQSNRVPRRFALLEKAGGEIFATNYKYIWIQARDRNKFLLFKF